MSDVIYLNGRFVDKDQACISVMDRGFLFGDGVYEVIPAYAGKLFRLEEHLDRLDNSLVGIRINNPHSHEEWSEILNSVLKTVASDEASVYLQITRGAAEKRDHSFSADLVPTVFAMASPIAPVDPSLAEKGAAAITLPDSRWLHCNLKTITLLANALLRQEAVDDGAAEAILIRDGYAMEGAASNLFIVRESELITPPKGPLLLPGITRDLVLELACEHDLHCNEKDIPEAWLTDADEIWITSSTKEVVPITSLNNQPVGDGAPGPVWKKMQSLYQARKDQLRKGHD